MPCSSAQVRPRRGRAFSVILPVGIWQLAAVRKLWPLMLLLGWGAWLLPTVNAQGVKENAKQGVAAVPDDYAQRMEFVRQLPEFATLPEHPELPNPLRMQSGAVVENAVMWREQRRPELFAMFQRYMYGVAPAAPKMTSVVRTPASAVKDPKGAVSMRLKEVDVVLAAPGDKNVTIHLALFMPAQPGKYPVVLALNPCGNARVIANEAVTIIPDNFCGEGCGDNIRGKEAEFWCADYITERGYILATFHESDIDPDRHDFADGVHAAYPIDDVPQEARWGTIAAWAWGLSRAMDYLVTDEEVDPRRVIVAGHSRRGKTALWAAASDERFAMAIPHQSGTGGTALSRNNDQETVERINRVFPHWFNDAFVSFGGQESKLPIDQHLLVALVAPRPLLDTAGTEDAWANFPSGQKSLQAAQGVYQLLGAPGLVGTGIVDEQTAFTPAHGNLVQYRQVDKHTWNRRFWRAMLDFADLWLPRP